MWFHNWSGVFRVLIVGAAAYATLVILLRLSGKRTLTKLNAFDLVVTVALGSTLATVLLAKDVAAAEGLAAFLVLICGQYVISRLSVRSPAFSRLVKSEPRVLVWQGKPLARALREERITVEEVESAVRGAGLDSLTLAATVILETDGALHVLRSLEGDGSSLPVVPK